VHLYGSSRLGIAGGAPQIPELLTLAGDIAAAKVVEVKRGEKFFEWSNHLGNVLATVSDRKIAHTSNSSTIDYYEADLVSAQDYYPFGMIMPGRKFSNETYRYGFQKQEVDVEISGVGNHIEFRFREYEPRLARFWSIDPLAISYPWNSTYAFAENDVIRSIDLEGRERSIVLYDFSTNKITKTKIDLPKAGPLGNGVLVQSNYGGQTKYFYGNEITKGNVTSFKRAYEGVKLDNEGNHIGYPDINGFPTIGYGHRIKEGEPYKIGGKISDKEAQNLFKADQNWIFKRADKLLSKYSLSENQKNALYDASFNMGPEKMQQYDENGETFSGGNFFFKFMGDGDSVSKRRYAENLLYSEGLYLHLDLIKSKITKATVRKIIAAATSSSKSTEDKTKTEGQ
jgi:RHS repeat-associated protein